MLNLSDKELDRLAREAASEYDPGDLSSPGSWDRMQLRLDGEMGYPRMNPFRSIRRMSFYYAPAILLLAGASWFFFRPSRSHPVTHPPGAPATSTAQAASSGSPPLTPPLTGSTAIQSPPANPDRSIKNQNNTYSPTSTQSSAPSASGTTTNPGATPHPGATTHSGTIIDSRAQQGISQVQAGRQTGSPNATGSGTQPPASSNTSGTQQPDPGNPIGGIASLSPSPGSTHTSNGGRTHHIKPGSDHTTNSLSGTTPLSDGTSSTQGHALHTSGETLHTQGQASGVASNDPQADNTQTGTAPDNLSNGASTKSNAAPSPAPLSYSIVSGIKPDRLPAPVIDDAALRKSAPATTAKIAEPVNPGKTPSHSMNINRRLQIGLSLAPDFTSVNSLAGDKPGSNIGITASYQIFSRWHLQTGFMLSHRNYTAAQQDYHVPYDYYRMNNMHDVYFVKGSLNLFEIPLNLRYDFSVSGNTSFFVSGGVSSYLVMHENCNYYFDLFGRTAYQEYKYDDHQNSLFGTVNLSMGVETGLTNSLSLLIAPYMKIPTTGLGFGRIEMNSVGVEIGLKYAPVLRRKRH